MGEVGGDYITLRTLLTGAANNSFNRHNGSKNSQQVMRQLFKEMNSDE